MCEGPEEGLRTEARRRGQALGSLSSSSRDLFS